MSKSSRDEEFGPKPPESSPAKEGRPTGARRGERARILFVLLPLVRGEVGPVEPGRDHGHLDGARHPVVAHVPEEDDRLGIRGLADDLGRLVDLEEGQVRDLP